MSYEKNKEFTAKQAGQKYDEALRRLKNYERVLIETLDYIKKEIVNTDYLLRVLEKLGKEDLGRMSIDEFYRKNFGFNTERFNRLINNGTTLNPEELENITIYLKK